MKRVVYVQESNIYLNIDRVAIVDFDRKKLNNQKPLGCAKALSLIKSEGDAHLNYGNENCETFLDWRMLRQL